MRTLRDYDLARGQIVEHREEGMVVGPIAYGGVNGDGFVGIGWSHDGMNRTTVFHPSSWKHRVVGNVIFLRRTGEDTGMFDVPDRTANLYTIILKL
jgi:hypothetical protein